MRNDENRRRYLSQLEGTTHFLLGDEACAYGAIFAGIDLFAGYPITPASEIAELLARELPKAGGLAIQMEDELASMAAIVGGAWTGARTMTATSGPGFSLMQENLGYAIMTETPCVVVDVQRSGPSTGQATKPAQGDMLQARWGTHGDHEIIALAPNSAQECFDLMLRCFDLADTYRTPVILLMDGAVGHIRESVTMPRLSTLEQVQRKPLQEGQEPFGGKDPVPGMAHFGQGRNLHVTGSTHKASGMRDVTTQAVHDSLVRRLYHKIDGNRERIVRVEEDLTPEERVPAGGGEDGEGGESGEGGEDCSVRVGLIAYGAASRPARGAVELARQEGLDVDLLRLITIWPFAREQVTRFGRDREVILVPEMNLGQISREVERFVHCEVRPVSKIGGIPHTVNEIHQAIRQAVKEAV